LLNVFIYFLIKFELSLSFYQHGMGKK